MPYLESNRPGGAIATLAGRRRLWFVSAVSQPQSNAPLVVYGTDCSYYTGKLETYLRAKGIAYRLEPFNERNMRRAARHTGVVQIPQVECPDGSWLADTTPILAYLERTQPEPSFTPRDPATAFAALLIEDYADEWLNKAMFHYRWHYDADIEKAGDILPRWRGISAPEEAMRAAKAQFARRQIDRLYVVGSNPTTTPVIEDSYLRFLAAFEAHLAVAPFLTGARPGASDFGVYGQLTQLAHFDPTPEALTLARARRVYAWVDIVDDLSGLEPEDAGWFTRDTLPATLHALLAEVGRVHVPALLANARALKAGAGRVETEIDGRAWVQQPFPYQGRCLQWLRESFHALAPADRERVRALLEPAGVKLALGEGPKAVFGAKGRLPGTRMGSAYVVRKALLDAAEYARKRKDHQAAVAAAKGKKGAEPPSAPPRSLDLEPLADLLDGKLMAFVECHRADDIQTALRLVDEFRFKAVLVGATEAYKCAAEIAKRGLPVVVGVMGVGSKRVETKDVRLENAATLAAAGIKTAVAAEDALGIGAQEELALSAALAAKGGLDRTAALRAVTLTAAELMGVASRVGSLEPGKDADFAIWSGSPLSPYSRCEQTWIEGRKYTRAPVPHEGREALAKERDALIARARAAKDGATAGPGGGGRRWPPRYLDDTDQSGNECGEHQGHTAPFRSEAARTAQEASR